MHVVNLALHAACAVVLFLVLRAMTASVWPSAFVAAVFAVHPLHVESVAWITERKDVLSGLFGLLVLGAYAWYARGPSAVRYLSVAAALTLGLMAKPILVTWPLLFLLLDYWPLDRQFRVGLLLEKVPLLLLVAADAAVTFLAHRSTGAVVSMESVPVLQRVFRGAVLYVAYLGKTLWPVNLAVVYPDQPMESCWPALVAWVLLALVTAGALWGAWCGQRWLAVGWFWYLGTQVPTIGLVQVGAEVMADRFLYLPQIGLCIALAWGAADLAGPWPYHRWTFAVVAALVLAVLMACAWRQTAYWRDSETLWTHALACTSNNAVAHNDLGGDLMARGEVNEAIVHYGKALEITPDYVDAHYNLALLLASRGQFDEAILHYGKALELKPDHAEAHNNLGSVLAARGRGDEAIAHYRRALEIQPDNAEANYNLGLALAGCRQFVEAIPHYRRALEIQPDRLPAHNNLANALAAVGQFDEAIAHYRKALEIQPNYAEGRFNLGLALARRGIIDEALEQFQKALALASARNDRALADRIRAGILRDQPVAPDSSPP